MSRGGGGFRGGGRGGRGGARGGRSGPPLPWESDEVDGRPSETFPPYSFKSAGTLTDAENRYVNNFLLYQRQIHDGPLYTKKHTIRDPTRPKRIYDQQQRNKQYAVKTKATADIFTGVETWSSKFKANERNLPDFSTRPYLKRLFPAELHVTLDGADGPGGKKKQGDKKLKLSTVTSLPTAEELFRMHGAKEGGSGFDAALMKKLELGEVPEEGQEEAYDSEAAEEEDEDYAYDDEDAGDYDAEAYFDDGDGDGDDGDDGGDDGGYY
ncbi:hypothetical protein jhhlp_007805 [Lomentospora prolificans]|uniref:DNA-directed RNA polymerase III subunit n=1 Tax=Lomentospora prolificans TaxID=41688 RepID=A0A2N3N0N7_9PEZI|nr:hypothetical protein jhhlp_007805 [Lomentospora prolificans]